MPSHAPIRLMSRRSVLGAMTALPVLPWFANAAGAGAAALGDSAIAAAKAADQVLDVMEFEALARAVLPPAHFGYLATGVDDDRTAAWNHDAFSQIEIRARRFVDVSELDSSVRVLGSRWNSPIYLSAVSGMRAFHNEGETAVARAAAASSTKMMLSTGASVPMEAVAQASGAPLWQQLYATDDWQVTEGLVRRAEGAGCTAIVLTVDTHLPRNTETLSRAMRADTRPCTACHIDNSHDMVRRAPMFQGLDVSHVHELSPNRLTVEYLDRLRQLVRVKLILKRHRNRRGCDPRLEARSRRHRGIEPWRPRRGNSALNDRVPPRGRVRCGRAHSRPARWRRSPRHRRIQSHSPGRDRGRHRPPPGLGTGRFRAAGRRSGARHLESRIEDDHAPSRRAVDQRHRRGSRAEARLSRRVTRECPSRRDPWDRG